MKSPLLMEPSAPPAPHAHHHHYPPVPEADGPFYTATTVSHTPATNPHNNKPNNATWDVVTDPKLQQEFTRPLQQENSPGPNGPFYLAEAQGQRRAVEEDDRAEEADRQGIYQNIRDQSTLRKADKHCKDKAKQGTQGLQVDPLLHDEAPPLSAILASVSPPKHKEGEKGQGGEKKDQSGGGGAGRGHGDYNVSEYKIADYQTSDYKSIYD